MSDRQRKEVVPPSIDIPQLLESADESNPLPLSKETIEKSGYQVQAMAHSDLDEVVKV